MSKKIVKSKRRRVLVTFVICFFIISLMIITSIGNIMQINEKNKEKAQLLNKLEELKEEEKTLSDDVQKLKNPEYAARYAREKYLYSKTGEKILKID